MFRLSKIKFFDPACGSGNFLIIAYKSIRELEIQIWKRLRQLGSDRLPFSNISLTQFYGIEIDEYACDTAKLSLWLAEHQVNNLFWKELGSKADALPLGKSGNIVCGNACRLDWNTVCPHTAEEEVYVMGNPPYLGSRNQENMHKEDLDISLSILHNYRKLDYIAIWFWKGANYILNSTCKLAFVSTNSITQGEQVSYIWQPIFEGGVEILFAHKSFKWNNNAKNNANVVVVIIGLANKSKKAKKLFTHDQIIQGEYINGYLSLSGNVFITNRNTALTDDVVPILYGSEPREGGGLMMTPEEKQTLLREGVFFGKFVKRAVGSDEFINDIERYCLWINDNDIEEARKSTFISARLSFVEQYRKTSKRADTRKYSNKPNCFTNNTYKAKQAIVIPIISSERREYIPIGFLSFDAVVLNSAFAVYDAELWLFALLTSKLHNVWVRAVGGKLEERIRYSATLCYNTFPFPKITKEQKEHLTELAEEVLLTRENHTEMTLGEMYNPETMPDDLKQAHHELDIAVEQCYRPEPFTSDDERLEYLFKLYERMTKKK